MNAPQAAAPLEILIVDDEANIRKMLTVQLETEGHAVIAVGGAREGLEEAARRTFDMAFVDLRLGTENGLDLIPALRTALPGLKIIVITAYASIDSAVEAMRRGATDYIPKPFTPAQIRLAIRKVFDVRTLEQRITALQDDLVRSRPEIDFATQNPAMQNAVDLARRAASSDATILLRGESGTGKTALARAIHGWSPRAAGPMGTLSCPSFPADLLESELFGHRKGAFTGAVRDNPGRIAACEGGTLLLDEIGDLPLSLQPKLLRFIQDREYERVGDSMTRRADVRLIAATNLNLEEAVKSGKFREDLYYRLAVIQIPMPPLRDRPSDIAPLAGRLLAFHAGIHHRAFPGFTHEAESSLRRYAWPGNVRELSNVIERAVILGRGEKIGVEDLAAVGNQAGPTLRIGDPMSLDAIEEAHIRSVLSAAKSLREAAETLGIDQATLWRRRKKYGI